MEETFESYRAYLFAIAYRMLGSAMDAEDMLQETYVRYAAIPKESIRSLKAYLATILTRLCIDQLQLARRKREVYVGTWLPEPILTPEAYETSDPEMRLYQEESISLAFLVLLEELQPFEQAVFLLREVFNYEYDEIAAMLGKSEAACRRSSICYFLSGPFVMDPANTPRNQMTFHGTDWGSATCSCAGLSCSLVSADGAAIASSMC